MSSRRGGPRRQRRAELDAQAGREVAGVGGALGVGPGAERRDGAEARDRGGIGAGEIIAGAVVIGGLAALAGAFDNDRDDRRYDYRDRDFRGGWDRGGFGNPRTAVDRCVHAAENQARRFGGYRYADVIDIRQPRFQWGQQVRAAVHLYNDGSLPGADEDALVVAAGGPGEVVQVGHHTQANVPLYLVDGNLSNTLYADLPKGTMEGTQGTLPGAEARSRSAVSAPM